MAAAGATAALIVGPLATADPDGISLSQTPGAAGNLTITGALASGGVATLDVPRRVLLTTAADETTKTFTVYGTDRYGRAQSEVLAGVNATTTYTSRDFLTVTRVAVSAATTGAVTIGTNGVASSPVLITDAYANPNQYGATVRINGTAAVDVEVTGESYEPDWDLATNVPVWTNPPGLVAVAANMHTLINQPCTAIRATLKSGTGSAQVTIQQAPGFTQV